MKSAAVVPIEVYRQWKRGREELFAVIREVQAANAAADPEEVLQEALEAQQAMRRASAGKG